MGEEAKPIAPLSPQEKRALLAQMLRRKAEGSRPEYPLSYGQRALWFFQQVAPASAVGRSGATAGRANTDSARCHDQAIVMLASSNLSLGLG